MKIGIIGAGNIGAALARRFIDLGHEVAIANSRGPDTLREVEAETGAAAVTTHEAAQGRDVVVVTIPEKNVAQLPEDLFKGVDDRVVVIDTGNYYPRQRDGRIDEIEQGMPESVWAAHHSAGLWSRLSTTSMPSIYATTADQLARPAGLRCPWPAMITRRSRS